MARAQAQSAVSSQPWGWWAGAKGLAPFTPGKVPLPFFVPTWPMRCTESEPLTCELGKGGGARERGPLYTEF